MYVCMYVFMLGTGWLGLEQRNENQVNSEIGRETMHTLYVANVWRNVHGILIIKTPYTRVIHLIDSSVARTQHRDTSWFYIFARVE